MQIMRKTLDRYLERDHMMNAQKHWLSLGKM